MCPSETINGSFEWSPSTGLFEQESRPDDPYYSRNPNLYRYSPWDFQTENDEDFQEIERREEEVDHPLNFLSWTPLRPIFTNYRRLERSHESHESLLSWTPLRPRPPRPIFIDFKIDESHESYSICRSPFSERLKEEPLDNSSSRSVELKDGGNLPSPSVPKDKLVWMNQKKMRSQSVDLELLASKLSVETPKIWEQAAILYARRLILSATVKWFNSTATISISMRIYLHTK